MCVHKAWRNPDSYTSDIDIKIRPLDVQSVHYHSNRFDDETAKHSTITYYLRATNTGDTPPLHVLRPKVTVKRLLQPYFDGFLAGMHIVLDAIMLSRASSRLLDLIDRGRDMDGAAKQLGQLLFPPMRFLPNKTASPLGPMTPPPRRPGRNMLSPSQEMDGHAALIARAIAEDTLGRAEFEDARDVSPQYWRLCEQSFTRPEHNRIKTLIPTEDARCPACSLPLHAPIDATQEGVDDFNAHVQLYLRGLSQNHTEDGQQR